MTASTFPMLIELFPAMLAAGPSDDAFAMVDSVYHGLSHALQLYVPKHLKQVEVMHAWVGTALSMVVMDMPPEAIAALPGQVLTDEQLNKKPFFRVSSAGVFGRCPRHSSSSPLLAFLFLPFACLPSRALARVLMRLRRTHLSSALPPLPTLQAKRAAMNAIRRLINHDLYNRASAQHKSAHKKWATQWNATYSVACVQAVFTLLGVTDAAAATGEFVPLHLLPREVMAVAYSFIAKAMRVGTVYKDCIKPRVEGLIRAVLPALRLTQEELEEWSMADDQYVGQIVDMSDDSEGPRYGAEALLTDLVVYRTSASLDVVGQLVNQCLAAYVQGTDADPLSLALNAEAALRIMCIINAPVCNAIREELDQAAKGKPPKRPFQAVVEEMAQLVVSVLASQDHTYDAGASSPPITAPFLRARAYLFIRDFSNVPMSNPAIVEACAQGIVNDLGDHSRDLTARAIAAEALHNLITQGHASHRPSIDKVFAGTVASGQSAFEVVLDGLLALLNTSAGELVNDTFTAIFEEYEDNIQGYTLQLGKALGEQMMRLLQQVIHLDEAALASPKGVADSGDEVDNPAEMTVYHAMGLFRSATSLLYAVRKTPVAVFALGQHILPPLEFIFVKNMTEMMTDALDVLHYFTYLPNKITDATWGLLPHLCLGLQTWAHDLIDTAMPALVNFITRDAADFAAHISFEKHISPATYKGPPMDAFDLLISVVDFAYGPGPTETSFNVPIAKLLTTLAGMARDNYDPLVPTLAVKVVARLVAMTAAKKASLNNACFLLIDALSACLYSAPRAVATVSQGEAAADRPNTPLKRSYPCLLC